MECSGPSAENVLRSERSPHDLEVMRIASGLPTSGRIGEACCQTASERSELPRCSGPEMNAVVLK
jgi:hypothetical protein